jgi:hypothetical protein
MTNMFKNIFYLHRQVTDRYGINIEVIIFNATLKPIFAFL